MTSKKNKSKWIVLKFGGTSVSSLENWRTIGSILNKRIKDGYKPLVVCSAMQGMSDDLERLLKEAVSGKHSSVLKEVEGRCRELAVSLDVKFDLVSNYLDDISQLATGISMTREITPRLHAQVMAHGELILTKFGAAYLNSRGVKTALLDARDFLVSKELHGENLNRSYLSAHCDYSFDQKLKGVINGESVQIVLTQGFIARNKGGETVLLGRGGSDTSASYFASKIGASRCEIWTDVPGMYTANPRLVPSARLLKTLDYEEAMEIASTGSKVLHPGCIPPLKLNNIPLHIFSLEHPTLGGTVVSSDSYKANAQVKAISAKRGIVLISMDSLEMWHHAGFLADLFSCFKRHGLSIDLVSTSETNVTVTLDQTANALASSALDALVRDLKNICKVDVVDSCGFVSLVGRNIRAVLHQLGPALKVFEEQRIYLVSQAANDLNLTFVVDDGQVERLVGQLHEQIFEQYGNETLLGGMWQELFKKAEPERCDWWIGKRDQLLELAKKETPLYVYDGKTIENSLANLKSIKGVDRVFYSIKANSNPELLETVSGAEVGFECVSVGELKHIQKLFPDISQDKIMFTPNFASKGEYKFGFELGVTVTLDNLYPLKMWPEIFKNREIFVRMDPGKGRGHHEYVHTAGSKSKFGVSPSEVEELKALVKSCNAKVIGLHAHVGSNIYQPDTWSGVAFFLATVVKEFPDVRTLDLGGGLGVIEKPGQEGLNVEMVGDELLKFKDTHPAYKIWLEPGRFVAAEAGVLLARVTQTKQKGDHYYIGIDTGMNSLIRPALYGSYHEIVNLTRPDDSDTCTANIVGPICESGDILGHVRRLSRPKDGDVILIATVGAYGRVMSSSYNMRPPANEFYLK